MTVFRPTEIDPHAAAANRLRYSRPATRWTEALPLGNGRLGAMYFGGVERDHLQLNDGTCWSGSPASGVGAPLIGAGTGAGLIEQARAALLAGDVRAAEGLLGRLQSGHSQSFVPLADLWIDHAPAPAAGYRRSLDLRTAVAAHAYRDGVSGISQEAWISAPARALVVRRQASGPRALPATLIHLTVPHPTATSIGWAGGVETVVRMPSHVVPPHEDLPDPIRYESGAAVTALLRVRVLTDGMMRWSDEGLHVTDARDLLIVVGTETDYADPYTHPHGDVADLRHRLGIRFDELESGLSRPEGYRLLRAQHVDDHAALFGRVDLRLGSAENAEQATRKDTDERIRRHAAGESDPSLAALLFQYGRYLLIASSRPGGLPANLQGIWNDKVRPPWSSNYTTNINLEMNYWPAEVAGLPECHEPLLDWLAHASRRGAEAARDHYGATGWLLHHNSDVWCYALPAGQGDADPAWSFWPLGAAWLSRHLFDHYDFGRNPVFLRERAWPLVRGAAEFCLDWLVELPDGTLGTAPATSPENHYLAADGLPAAVSSSTTSDLVLVRDLLGRGLDLLAALPDPSQDDLRWAERARAALGRLPAERVGGDGRISEWSRDVLDAEPEHRHTSHLIGLYPGSSIDADVTPDLAVAARATLDARGPKSTGWSLAWRLALRARLRDTGGAEEMLRMFLTPMADDASEEPSMTSPAGVYRNLFCAHPPFQIDGNFGLTAGIAELLVQSHATTADTTVVHLLPALPAAWWDGSFTGLRARGGVTVDARWSDGAVTEVALHATAAREVVLRFGGTTREVRLDGLAVHRVLMGASALASSTDTRPVFDGGLQGQPVERSVDQFRDDRVSDACPVQHLRPGR